MRQQLVVSCPYRVSRSSPKMVWSKVWDWGGLGSMLKLSFCADPSAGLSPVAGMPQYPLNFYFLEGSESVPYKKANARHLISLLG